MKIKANKLFFISQIQRDGKGVLIIDDEKNKILQSDIYIDEFYEVNSLSLSNKTYIASGFNSYVVKLI